MELKSSTQTKEQLSTTGIVLITVALLIIAFTIAIIYNTAQAVASVDSSNAAAGVVSIGTWFIGSLTGLAGVVLLCAGASILPAVKRPSKTLLTSDAGRSNYSRKTSLLGLIWLVVVCVSALGYVYGSSFVGRYIVIEPICLATFVFGIVNTVKYTLWSRAVRKPAILPGK